MMADMNILDCDWLHRTLRPLHKRQCKGLYISDFDMPLVRSIQGSLYIQACK